MLLQRERQQPVRGRRGPVEVPGVHRMAERDYVADGLRRAVSLEEANLFLIQRVAFDTQVVDIGLFDFENQLLRFPYTIERGERIPDEPVPITDTARELIETRKPMVIDDAEAWAASRGRSLIIQGEAPKSLVFAPLISADRVFGRISLQNLDHGLWHGKLIDEVRHSQPKVYRQLQERPETVCPPDGEPLGAAFDRVKSTLEKLLKKHKTSPIAVVIPEPLFTLVRSLLEEAEVGDLWKAECEEGGWCVVDVDASADLTWRIPELAK